jgi:two-component system, OmpR family, sensor histidine kinase BaeS
MRQSTLHPELYASAAAAGILGAAICYDARPGLNWSLWTILVATELAIFARPRLGANRAAFHVTIALAVILGIAPAVTANPASIALILITVATLLGVAARLAAGTPAPLLGARELFRVPLRATIDAMRESYARVESATRVLFSDAGAHVTRGVAIAIPVVVVFAALLAGADPTLSAWLHAVSGMLSDWSWLPRFVFFCVLATLSLGSFGLAAGGLIAASPPATTSGARFVLGDTERRIVVGAVDALFALFLVLVAFVSPPQGQSYTQYVHNGFSQLTIVATLSVVLVAVLHNGRPRVGTPWGTLALLAECELLVASALHRLAVYQRDYGYTALRMWVTAYMLLVAALLVLVAYDVARPVLVDVRRFVRRGAVLSVAALTVMVYGNPDAWVARLELHRYQTTGKANLSYLSELSSDAVPSLLTIAAALPPGCVDRLRLVHHEVITRPIAWYEWNWRQSRAHRALRAYHSPTFGECQVQPW